MISFVYFDVGGVLIRDFSGTHKFFELQRDIGITEKNKEVFEKLWIQYREEICISRDIDSLMPLIEISCDLKLPKNYSLLSDFVNRFEFNTSIWPVVAKIHAFCRVGLLTNMYPRMYELIQKRKLLPPVVWDVVVDSFKVGLQKPDINIFKLAEKMSGVSKNEILFVENSQEHVDAAHDFGWHTFLYDSKNPIHSSEHLLEIFEKM